MLTLVCLTLLLTGCTKQVITKLIPQYPPQAYLTKCERSSFNGETYGDILNFLVIVIQERDICAKQIDGVNEWKDNVIISSNPTL